MGNTNKIRWTVLVIIALASFVFLTSCSQEISGVSAPVSSQTEAATPVTTTAPVTAAPAAETPAPLISDYRLAVDGLVDRPLALTYEAILQYPSVTDNPWLICPGVFETQSEWTGVPVALILKEAGLKAEAVSIGFYASDGYSQILSIQEAQKESVFLAYKCDGQVLSQDDGYPLRVVAGEQLGLVWVKRLARIEVR
jgi:DMSO/TMAO reductase YedYZ molybdopterin-dependent catalytic subunit